MDTDIRNEGEAQGRPSRAGSHAQEGERVLRMGTASIPRLIAEFAIPSIVGMMVNGSYNIIDSMFLGHALGGIKRGRSAL